MAGQKTKKALAASHQAMGSYEQIANALPRLEPGSLPKGRFGRLREFT